MEKEPSNHFEGHPIKHSRTLHLLCCPRAVHALTSCCLVFVSNRVLVQTTQDPPVWLPFGAILAPPPCVLQHTSTVSWSGHVGRVFFLFCTSLPYIWCSKPLTYNNRWRELIRALISCLWFNANGFNFNKCLFPSYFKKLAALDQRLKTIRAEIFVVLWRVPYRHKISCLSAALSKCFKQAEVE